MRAQSALCVVALLAALLACGPAAAQDSRGGKEVLTLRTVGIDSSLGIEAVRSRITTLRRKAEDLIDELYGGRTNTFNNFFMDPDDDYMFPSTQEIWNESEIPFTEGIVLNG